MESCVGPLRTTFTCKHSSRVFFFSLKRWTFFISPARPAIYDLAALKAALDNGILVAAADALTREVPLGDEVRDDALGGALGDADFGGHIAG